MKARGAVLAAVLGLFLGTLAVGMTQAPAAWASQWVARLSQGRIFLAHAQGSVWNGTAQLVLSAGPDALQATALPGRLQWNWSWHSDAQWGSGPALEWRHTQAMPAGLALQSAWKAGSLHLRTTVPLTSAHAAPNGGVATIEAPAALLEGLGAPWNTLHPTGRLRLTIEQLEWVLPVAMTPAMNTRLRLDVLGLASPVSTLPVLGDYALLAHGSQELQLELRSSARSALQLSGHGQWSPAGGMRFQGVATAAPAAEAALSNLLNILGRRDGNRSVISL